MAQCLHQFAVSRDACFVRVPRRPASGVLALALLLGPLAAGTLHAQGGGLPIRPRPDQTPMQSRVLDANAVLDLLQRYYGSDLLTYEELVDYYPAAGIRYVIEIVYKRGAGTSPPALALRGLESAQAKDIREIKVVYWNGDLTYAMTESPKDQTVKVPPAELGKLFDGSIDAALSRRLNLLPHLPLLLTGNAREALLKGQPTVTAYAAETPGFVCLRLERKGEGSTLYTIRADTGQIRRIEQTTAAGRTATVDIPALSKRNALLKDDRFQAHAPVRPTPTPAVASTPTPTPPPALPTVPPTGGVLLDSDPQLGRLAADFTYPTAQATRGRLFNHLGKVVLLAFWDSSYPQSGQVLTSLRDLSRQYPRGTVQVIAVNVKQELGPAIEMIERLADADMVHIVDPKTDGARAHFQVPRSPVIYILDRSMFVRGVYVGWQADAAKAIRNVVDAQLTALPTTLP